MNIQVTECQQLIFFYCAPGSPIADPKPAKSGANLRLVADPKYTMDVIPANRHCDVARNIETESR